MRGRRGTQGENRLSKRTGDDLPDLGLAPHERHLPEVASVQVMDFRATAAERACGFVPILATLAYRRGIKPANLRRAASVAK